jgi:NAD(P)-dependent dehydrogenase (short-subunit alcohol dehydrogenase family)
MTTSALVSLAGRTAFVSGAGGHLGRSISAGLGEAGAVVYLNGRRAESLRGVQADLAAKGIDGRIAAFDITDEAAARAFFATVPRLDVLVHSAYARPAGSGDDPAQYEAAHRLGAGAAALLLRAARPSLDQAVVAVGQASVIALASMYGMVSPDPSIYGASAMNSPAYYGAAKAALLQFVRHSAVHLAPVRIRVNAISPGPFPRPTVTTNNPDFHAALARRVPLGRIGQPDELQGPAVFLASDAASFVTGANLVVDGGWTTW